MKEVIFDSDDFCMFPKRNCLEDLLYMKERFPKFKATLFTVPRFKGYDQTDFFTMVKKEYGDWLEMALHGYLHDSNFECQKWTYDDATRVIEMYSGSDLFVHGFKAPGWQISRETYQAMRDNDYWVLDHEISIYTEDVPNKFRRPEGLRFMEINDPRLVHTHTWDTCNNGIGNMINTWSQNGFPFDQEAEFRFISEVI